MGNGLLGSFAMPSMAYLIGATVFSTIGLAAFIYGKKRQGWRAMTLGVLLMIYPFFTDVTWIVYLVGAALTAALYFWRD
jgi:predicted phage tail protein